MFVVIPGACALPHYRTNACRLDSIGHCVLPHFAYVAYTTYRRGGPFFGAVSTYHHTTNSTSGDLRALHGRGAWCCARVNTKHGISLPFLCISLLPSFYAVPVIRRCCCVPLLGNACTILALAPYAQLPQRCAPYRYLRWCDGRRGRARYR